ncbi:putative ABC transporter ATP-binding protein YufO [Nymphon striatum]|nr:putative ABC transporter ATP-binding protein YufO [Nymphon striatum]
MLADQLTVLENVILGAEPMSSAGRINFKEAEKHLSRVAEEYGLTVDPNDMAESLEVGERQRVEIIKVLFRGAEILILDEPTAVLVPQEVEALFENMRELKASGATILFIDHKLDEVLEISDSITVLRHGKTISTMKNDGVTAGDLAELMAPYGSRWLMNRTGDATKTETIREQFDVRTPNIDVSAHALSGGKRRSSSSAENSRPTPRSSSPRTHPRHRRWGAGRGVGADSRGSKQWPGHAAIFRRSRRAHWPLRHHCGDAARAPVARFNPFAAYGDMLSHASKLETQVDILNRATPLYLSAVAAAIGFRMNLFNIGVEGQYLSRGAYAGIAGVLKVTEA